jgi:pimeloyl-ACP methyl ester carboxylesterase
MQNKLLYFGLILAAFYACTKNVSPTYERFYFRTEGADIAVEVNGNIASKTFILLLHGGPGGGALVYNQGLYSELLESKYAMVYMDQRGNGASQGDYSSNTLTLDQNSKDVYNLSLFLKAKYGGDISLFLMGHSWGGITSGHALTHSAIQSELKGWIEVDGLNDFTLNYLASYRFFNQIAAQELALGNEPEFWNEIVTRLAEMDTNNFSNTDKYFLNSKGFEAENKLSYISNPTDSSASNYTILNSPNVSLSLFLSNNLINPIYNENSALNPITNQLNQIKIPSLLMWGKYDFVVSPELGETAYQLIETPNKEFHIFENSGHSPMINEPESFVATVINFIEKYK